MSTMFALIFTWAACSVVSSVYSEDDDCDSHDWDDHYDTGVCDGASRAKKAQKKHKTDRSKGRKNHSLGSKVPEAPIACGWCNEPDSECTKCIQCLGCGHSQDSTCGKSFDDFDYDYDYAVGCSSENCDPRFCTCGPDPCDGPAGQCILARLQVHKLAAMMMQLYSQNPST